MPYEKRSHEDNRKVVCLLCMQKAKSMRGISSVIHDTIKEHVLEEYDANDPRLPSVVCQTCFTVLHEYRRGCFRRKIQVFDSANLKPLKPTTRSQESCDCTVCEIGRSTFQSPCDVHVQKRPSVGRPTNHQPEKRCPIKVCNLCLSHIARGVSHSCTQTSKTDNLKKFVDNSPQQSKDHLASRIIKEKMQTSPSPMLSQTTGRPLLVTLTSPKRNDEETQNQVISATDLGDIQNSLSLSTNKTRDLATRIRAETQAILNIP